MNCTISNQIAEHANEQESFSAFEILEQLIECDIATINNKTYQLYELTDLLDESEIRELLQSQLIGGSNEQMYDIYTTKIKELME